MNCNPSRGQVYSAPSFNVQLTIGDNMSSTHFLVKNLEIFQWEVVDKPTYETNKSVYKKPPLEIVSKEDEIRAIRHIAEAMNKSSSAERFWMYNASNKVDSGGRVGYALLLIDEH